MSGNNSYKISNFGRFLKNPQKYSGNVRDIQLRSSWEIKFAIMLDKREDVLQWGSETIVIPYLFESKPNTYTKHRYFTDFWMKVKDKDGNIKEYLIEIKPFHEMKMALELDEIQRPKRLTKSFIRKLHSAMKNKAKWEAAEKYCEQQRMLGKNIEFIILTEKDGIF